MNLFLAGIVEDLRWQAPPQDSPFWLWAGLGAGGALIGALLAFWLWRRKLSQSRIPHRAQPHVIALKALREIKPLLSEENSRTFVVQVSQIVRIYIAGRFRLRAPHRSSEEFLWEAAHSGLLSEEDQQLLAKFLARCDRVKFARGRVTTVQMEELFDAADRFVRGTMTVEPETAHQP